MSAEARAAAPAVHRALLYASLDELVAAAVAYAREGLRGGERMLFVVPGHKLDAIREALGADAGAVQMADSSAWYGRIGRTFSAFIRFLDRHAGPGGPRVRILAEGALAARSRSTARSYQRYESVANVAYSPYHASVLCPYELSALDTELIEGVRRTHPEVIEGGILRRSRSFTDPAAFIEQTERRQPPPPPRGPALEVSACEELSAARRFLAAAARRAGLDPQVAADVVTAAHELAVNALDHGGGAVRIHAWRDAAGFHCRLADRGRGLREPFAGYLPPRPGAQTGRGLWLAHQLCDLVEVSTAPDEGAVVHLVTAA